MAGGSIEGLLPQGCLTKGVARLVHITSDSYPDTHHVWLPYETKVIQLLLLCL
jgi:hypothetical protein